MGGGKQKHLKQESLNPQKSISHTASTDISLSNAQFFIQTSGSSGEPKFIAKNLYQMICEAKFLAGFFRLNDITKNGKSTSEVVFVGAIPHRHLFGLTFKVFLPLVCGGVVLKEQILSHHLLVEVLNTHKNAILLASPTVLEIMLKDEISHIKSPKIIICAGSPLDSHTRDGLQKRFNANKQTLQNIISIYGSSETGVIGYQDSKTTVNAIDKIQNQSSTFYAFPPVRLELDSTQRLVISSDWLDSFEGENAKFLSNDCAKIYDNNNAKEVVFTLLGRYDRIIKLNEVRISLDFVESILKNHSFIENARVGVLKGQNRLSAIITLTNEGKNAFRISGKKGIKSALKPLLDSAFLGQSASLVSALRYFYIRSKMPYNAQGKITLKDFEMCAREKVVPEFRIMQGKKPKMQIQSSKTCASSEIKSCVLESYIDEGCFYFDGHFSSFPLVPGFVEIGFALQNASKHLGIKLESISQIQSVKFSAFLRPCDMARLELVCSQNRLDFSLYANDKICSSGKVLLKNQPQNEC
ncbi:AMP-binding protein [Helicobacter sp. T3_23-1059]